VNTGLHSFVYACQICKILRKFELRTAQDHRRSSMLVPLESECSFLLIVNSNFGRISYRFRDIDAFSSYRPISFTPFHPCLTPPSGGTPADINIIYTLLESTFNGPHFRRWQYGYVFIHLAVVGSRICEIRWNSERIRPCNSSRSSKVIDLGVNRKRIYDFLLVINGNFGRICYRFRDIDV